MNRDWQRDLEIQRPTAAAVLPPVMVEETGWDILLALRSDQRRELTLAKLAAIASVPRQALGPWLRQLADQQLIAATRNPLTGEFRAVLTADGRDMLDRYLAAVSVLQSGSRH